MKISILISTYNGQLFFDEQINSILEQTIEDFTLIIRDDGSSNQNFIEQLKKYERQDDRVKVYLETNIGSTLSFLDLLKKCPIDSDYIFFADQDDIWKDTRIENTIKYIAEQNSISPLLSFCRYDYVDHELKYLSTCPKYKNIGFKNALVQNLATGCTICINNSALKLLLSHMPKHAVFHDWWIGGTTSILKKNKKRLNRKLNRILHKAYAQVDEFYSNYYKIISDETCRTSERFLKTRKSRISKILFIFDFKTVKREKVFDNIILKIVIAFSKKTVQK
jgi:glycosyltransferase involved in cell wall biosynthesis